MSNNRAPLVACGIPGQITSAGRCAGRSPQSLQPAVIDRCCVVLPLLVFAVGQIRVDISDVNSTTRLRKN